MLKLSFRHLSTTAPNQTWNRIKAAVYLPVRMWMHTLLHIIEIMNRYGSIMIWLIYLDDASNYSETASKAGRPVIKRSAPLWKWSRTTTPDRIPYKLQVYRLLASENYTFLSIISHHVITFVLISTIRSPWSSDNYVKASS